MAFWTKADFDEHELVEFVHDRNSGLDAIPVVGLAKNAVELFTGDFISDKPEKSNGRKRK